MISTVRRLLLVTALLAGLSGLTTTTVGAFAAATSSPRARVEADPVRAACSHPTGPRQAHCLALYRSTRTRDFVARRAGRPDGYGPGDLRKAYDLPARGGHAQVVAVVGAFDNPRVDADLAVYRAEYGLPPCTEANGCLRVVNQHGASAPLPPRDVGWGIETALDLDMVSATCRHCALLLVEADSANISDLADGVDTAVRLGADVVSNSYGIDENNGLFTFARHYRHPGTPVLAATGDNGMRAASFPAGLRSVIAVGGTRLTATPRGWRERAWTDGGSGCSAYVAKPPWQHDGHCPMRVVADVSADADPDTGPAFYDTYGLGSAGGWMIGGGTSVATPLIAGMIGLAGHSHRVSSPRYLYHHRAGFDDVVGGSNGFCGGDYLCKALVGYDAPTGIGTPRGLSGLGEQHTPTTRAQGSHRP